MRRCAKRALALWKKTTIAAQYVRAKGGQEEMKDDMERLMLDYQTLRAQVSSSEETYLRDEIHELQTSTLESFEVSKRYKNNMDRRVFILEADLRRAEKAESSILKMEGHLERRTEAAERDLTLVEESAMDLTTKARQKMKNTNEYLFNELQDRLREENAAYEQALRERNDAQNAEQRLLNEQSETIRIARKLRGELSRSMEVALGGGDYELQKSLRNLVLELGALEAKYR